MRFVVSAILGTAVVIAMLLTGLSFFDGKVDNASLRKGVEVTPLPAHSRLDVGELMRETRGDLIEPLEEDGPVLRLPPPPPFELARPEIQGFVQLVFTVGVDGRAYNIRVFGAAPAGYYEDQAVAVIEGRRWEPAADDLGRPAPRQATEIIEFTLPYGSPRHHPGTSP